MSIKKCTFSLTINVFFLLEPTRLFVLCARAIHVLGQETGGQRGRQLTHVMQHTFVTLERQHQRSELLQIGLLLIGRVGRVLLQLELLLALLFQLLVQRGVALLELVQLVTVNVGFGAHVFVIMLVIAGVTVVVSLLERIGNAPFGRGHMLRSHAAYAVAHHLGRYDYVVDVELFVAVAVATTVDLERERGTLVAAIGFASRRG